MRPLVRRASLPNSRQRLIGIIPTPAHFVGPLEGERPIKQIPQSRIQADELHAVEGVLRVERGVDSAYLNDPLRAIHTDEHLRATMIAESAGARTCAPVIDNSTIAPHWGTRERPKRFRGNSGNHSTATDSISARLPIRRS